MSQTALRNAKTDFMLKGLAFQCSIRTKSKRVVWKYFIKMKCFLRCSKDISSDRQVKDVHLCVNDNIL